MLSKLSSLTKSSRKVAAPADPRDNEFKFQDQSAEIPIIDLEDQIDHEGNQHFVDTCTGEWYRVHGARLERIDTWEKIIITTNVSKQEHHDALLKENGLNHEPSDVGHSGIMDTMDPQGTPPIISPLTVDALKV